MKAALFTPLPPERTGVAHYASILIPALAKGVDLEVVSAEDQRPASDLRIYQLGNNLHHEWIYRAAMEMPGVIVLHDVVLHHLIVETTLARGDVEGYVAAVRASHGAAGEAWARGRAAGLHGEIGNFLFPASVDVANRSRAVIVHNAYAADRLRSFGVSTPIFIVPHPWAGGSRVSRGEPDTIGLFGFLTSAKRADVVLQAFARARATKPALRLLVVGEPAPNIDPSAFAARGITFTGFVPDEAFDSYFDRVDRIVNLRYPSAGETSGTLIRAFAAGKPVAVSDYAQFAEFPDDCVVKIPLGENEISSLTSFFLGDLHDPSAPQRRWLEEHARVDLTVEGYVEAMEAGLRPLRERAESKEAAASIPLFPKLEIIGAGSGSITLRNAGDTTIRTEVYGEPGYRLIANGRWLELPRDLAPGQTAVIALPAGEVVLRHGLQGVPTLETEAWGRAVVR